MLGFFYVTWNFYFTFDIYWGTKVWNIDINFVVIKIQIKQYKNICLVKFEVLGYQNTKKLLSIMSISDPKINLNRLGSVKKMTEMRSKVWNIGAKFVVFKKYGGKSKNLCLFKFGVLGYRNVQK